MADHLPRVAATALSLPPASWQRSAERPFDQRAERYKQHSGGTGVGETDFHHVNPAGRTAPRPENDFDHVCKLTWTADVGTTPSTIRAHSSPRVQRNERTTH